MLWKFAVHVMRLLTHVLGVPGRLLQAALPRPPTPNGNPAPPVLHATLRREQLNESGRLVIVGDIHGCDDEFGELLQKVELSSTDTLVLVGDLVNKGPNSAGVLRRARAHNAFAVRGNHDDSGLAAYRVWLDGGDVKKKHKWVKELSREEAAWLEKLPFTLAIPAYQTLIVHAGLIPGVPLASQSCLDMYKMRDVFPVNDEDGNIKRWIASEKPLKGGKAWSKKWTGPEHVFFGHDAKRKLQLRTYATGLDTGCCYGGELTACVLPPLSSFEKGPDPTGDGSCRAGVTLKDLKGQLVTVASRRVYEEPTGGA